MRPCPRALALALLAALSLSCAGPTQLARQSDRELRAGNLQKAYELGRRAVDKDAESAPARRALTVAAVQLVDEWKARVLNATAIDTVAGADAAMQMRDLRAELARYQVEVPGDPGFFERERRVVDGAAGIEYRRGEASLAASRPKQAFAHYRRAAGFVASYRDVQERMGHARRLGWTRVAILPFANEVEVPGLARTMADRFYQAMIGRANFQFTELVNPDEIYAAMTVKEMEALPPEAATRIARGVEAQRVVVGRFHAMRARTDSWTFQYPIYRKVAERDTAGKVHERWQEMRFDGIARERVVTLRWDLRVLDARTGDPLADHSEAVETAARVAWTDFRADGDCGDYRLVPPDAESSERGKAVVARWKECFGGWTLPEMLERARHDRRRAVYQSSYRDEFLRADSRKRPVLCGELPRENDMATLALEGAWAPLLATLQELDPKD